MSRYLNQVTAAIRRLDLREPPDSDDVQIIRPILSDLESELAKDDPIRFCQIGRKYVVDTTEFRNLNGFHYLQALLKQPGEYIAATTMSPISKQVEFEPVAEHGVVRGHINRKKALIKKLKWMRFQREPNDLAYASAFDDEFEYSSFGEEQEFEIAEDLLKIEKFLSGATYNGKIKHVHNDYDRNRQTVSKCIRLAISYLEKNPDTTHIGHHLRTTIKTGAQCRYSGKWIWIFS